MPEARDEPIFGMFIELPTRELQKASILNCKKLAGLCQLVSDRPGPGNESPCIVRVNGIG